MRPVVGGRDERLSWDRCLGETTGPEPEPDRTAPDAPPPLTRRLVHIDARQPRLVVVILGLLIVAATVYSAHALFGLGGDANPHLWNHWVYDGIVGGSAAVCLWRAVAIRNDRAAWAAIGLGITLFWLGDLYWNNYLADLQTPPYPSWADAGWLAYYVPLYVGLMLILHRRVAGLPSACGSRAWSARWHSPVCARRSCLIRS